MTAPSAYEQPQLMNPVLQQVLDEMKARAQADRVAALTACAKEFARLASRQCDVPVEHMYSYLLCLPQNLLSLLDCPEGWTALGGYILAASPDATPTTIIPSIH